jgi:hypothetical protein
MVVPSLYVVGVTTRHGARPHSVHRPMSSLVRDGVSAGRQHWREIDSVVE